MNIVYQFKHSHNAFYDKYYPVMIVSEPFSIISEISQVEIDFDELINEINEVIEDITGKRKVISFETLIIAFEKEKSTIFELDKEVGKILTNDLYDLIIKWKDFLQKEKNADL